MDLGPNRGRWALDGTAGRSPAGLRPAAQLLRCRPRSTATSLQAYGQLPAGRSPAGLRPAAACCTASWPAACGRRPATSLQACNEVACRPRTREQSVAVLKADRRGAGDYHMSVAVLFVGWAAHAAASTCPSCAGGTCLCIYNGHNVCPADAAGNKPLTAPCSTCAVAHCGAGNGPCACEAASPTPAPTPVATVPPSVVNNANATTCVEQSECRRTEMPLAVCATYTSDSNTSMPCLGCVSSTELHPNGICMNNVCTCLNISLPLPQPTPAPTVTPTPAPTTYAPPSSCASASDCWAGGTCYVANASITVACTHALGVMCTSGVCVAAVARSEPSTCGIHMGFGQCLDSKEKSSMCVDAQTQALVNCLYDCADSTGCFGDGKCTCRMGPSACASDNDCWSVDKWLTDTTSGQVVSGNVLPSRISPHLVVACDNSQCVLKPVDGTTPCGYEGDCPPPPPQSSTCEDTDGTRVRCSTCAGIQCQSPCFAFDNNPSLCESSGCTFVPDSQQPGGSCTALQKFRVTAYQRHFCTAVGPLSEDACKNAAAPHCQPELRSCTAASECGHQSYCFNPVQDVEKQVIGCNDCIGGASCTNKQCRCNNPKMDVPLDQLTYPSNPCIFNDAHPSDDAYNPSATQGAPFRAYPCDWVDSPGKCTGPAQFACTNDATSCRFHAVTSLLGALADAAVVPPTPSPTNGTAPWDDRCYEDGALCKALYGDYVQPCSTCLVLDNQSPCSCGTSDASVAGYVGGIVVAILAILVVVGLLWCWKERKKPRKGHQSGFQMVPLGVQPSAPPAVHVPVARPAQESPATPLRM